MDRPYVVCHMSASVDGKIDGDYMSALECIGALTEYGALQKEYDCQAAVYGKGENVKWKKEYWENIWKFPLSDLDAWDSAMLTALRQKKKKRFV